MIALALGNTLLLGFVAGSAWGAMAPAAPPKLTSVGNPPNSQTAGLLARCGVGDAKAFRELYDLNSAPLVWCGPPHHTQSRDGRGCRS